MKQNVNRSAIIAAGCFAYPMFTKVVVDGHKITVEAENADTLQWIADGKVIIAKD